jgi:hypothetical protein
MKVFFALAVSVALCAGRAAYADCTYPNPPDHIPDGRTATMAEMVTAQKGVKEYDAAINAYLACIKLEHDDTVSKMGNPVKPGDKPTPEQQKAIDDLDRVEVQKHNAAIDQDHSVADRFNEQVRIFKSRSDQPKK